MNIMQTNYQIELSEDKDCVYVTTDLDSAEIVDDKITITLPNIVLEVLREVYKP